MICVSTPQSHHVQNGPGSFVPTTPQTPADGDEEDQTGGSSERASPTEDTDSVKSAQEQSKNVLGQLVDVVTAPFVNRNKEVKSQEKSQIAQEDNVPA